MLGSTTRDINEASTLCRAFRRTLFSCLCIKQFEHGLNGLGSLSARSTTKNNIVVSQHEAMSTSWRFLLCMHQPMQCVLWGSFIFSSVLLWHSRPQLWNTADTGSILSNILVSLILLPSRYSTKQNSLFPDTEADFYLVSMHQGAHGFDPGS